jgi:two-component system sensor histidine kinase KdpD
LIAFTKWLCSATALAGVVLIYLRWLHVNHTTVALTLLLLVLFLAARWGLRYAVITSIAATICYNYFFLPPVRTFTVADPQNWVALFAFLVTAIIGSRLSERVREEGLEARTRARELNVLYSLSRELLQTENVAALVNSIPETIARVTSSPQVLLFLLDGDRVYSYGFSDTLDTDRDTLRQFSFAPAATPAAANRQAQIPLREGVRPRGLLLIAGLEFSPETLDALGSLVSISLDRAQALEDVSRGNAAKESERLRSLMVDSITHELRTPLTSIKASATALLTSQTMSHEDRNELLTVIDEETDRLNRLVSQAVEMAQLDTQEVHITFEPVDVGVLVQQSLETCSSVLEKRDIRQVIAPNLPQVSADPEFMRKVLCNLLENGAKYSSPDTPIFIGAERHDKGVSLSVADRGVGIDPAEQGLIFEKFYRSKTQSNRTSGTGMGLAISKAIVEAHGGSLAVTSQLGRGSVFTIVLPVWNGTPSSTH